MNPIDYYKFFHSIIEMHKSLAMPDVYPGPPLRRVEYKEEFITDFMVKILSLGGGSIEPLFKAYDEFFINYAFFEDPMEINAILNEEYAYLFKIFYKVNLVPFVFYDDTLYKKFRVLFEQCTKHARSDEFKAIMKKVNESIQSENQEWK